MGRLPYRHARRAAAAHNDRHDYDHAAACNDNDPYNDHHAAAAPVELPCVLP